MLFLLTLESSCKSQTLEVSFLKKSEFCRLESPEGPSWLEKVWAGGLSKLSILCISKIGPFLTCCVKSTLSRLCSCAGFTTYVLPKFWTPSGQWEWCSTLQSLFFLSKVPTHAFCPISQTSVSLEYVATFGLRSFFAFWAHSSPWDLSGLLSALFLTAVVIFFPVLAFLAVVFSSVLV